LSQGIYRLRDIGVNVVVFLTILVLFSACEKGSDRNSLDEKLQSGEPVFVSSFTRDFATRFSLASANVISLSEGLQAIAVEFNRVNSMYSCKLHLYVGAELDVYAPAEGRYFFDGEPSSYFFISKINDQDYSEKIKKILDNNMKIKFLSSESAQYNFTETLSYARVHKSFLTGLTQLSIDTECDLFEQDRYPADIWIQKQNVGDYVLGNDGQGEVGHPENNYRFAIPEKLIQQIQPYVEIAVSHNEAQRSVD
jgi:hypothetical protein